MTKIADGVPTVGIGIHLSDAAIVELSAFAGFDWVSLTLENSTLSMADCAAMQRAADASGIPLLVHVPRADDSRILPLLHTGVNGIVLSRARTRAEVEMLVGVCRYPPVGERGAHPGVRSDGYGAIDYDTFVREADDALFVGIAIEDVEGVGNADEILSTPGLTMAWVGLYDLSHSLGVPNDLRHPRVMEALAGVVETAKRHNIPIGLPGYQHGFAELRDLGATLVMSPGNDYTFLGKALKAHVDSARAEFAG
jgi:staphyloferrin B biosynthesis citrate synthase